MVCAFPSVFNGPGAETGFHLIMMWNFLGQYNRGNRSKEIETLLQETVESESGKNGCGEPEKNHGGWI